MLMVTEALILFASAAVRSEGGFSLNMTLVH